MWALSAFPYQNRGACVYSTGSLSGGELIGAAFGRHPKDLRAQSIAVRLNAIHHLALCSQFRHAERHVKPEVGLNNCRPCFLLRVNIGKAVAYPQTPIRSTPLAGDEPSFEPTLAMSSYCCGVSFGLYTSHLSVANVRNCTEIEGLWVRRLGPGR